MNTSEIRDLILSKMTHYQSDLELDIQAIQRSPTVSAYIAVRTTGTVLIQLFPADSDAWPRAGESVPYLLGTATREHILEGNLAVGTKCAAVRDSILFVHYNGAGSFRTVCRPALEEDVTRHYGRTLDTWRRERNKTQAA